MLLKKVASNKNKIVDGKCPRQKSHKKKPREKNQMCIGFICWQLNNNLNN